MGDGITRMLEAAESGDLDPAPRLHKRTIKIDFTRAAVLTCGLFILVKGLIAIDAIWLDILVGVLMIVGAWES